jgi:hypothetical protein
VNNQFFLIKQNFKKLMTEVFAKKSDNIFYMTLNLSPEEINTH